MRRLVLPLLLIVATGACGDDDVGDSSSVAALSLQVPLNLAEISTDTWARADTLEEARAGAEETANLIVGSGGPDYGDLDGDGSVVGESEFGILAGLDGTPPGIAAAVENECIEADVLGGGWDDPAARWAELQAAIDAWSPTNDTISSLDSQPMQAVGWARLTMATESLEDAHEFGGRAQENIAESIAAIDC